MKSQKEKKRKEKKTWGGGLEAMLAAEIIISFPLWMEKELVGQSQDISRLFYFLRRR